MSVCKKMIRPARSYKDITKTLRTLGFARYYLLQDLHNNRYLAVGKHENILLKLLMNFAVRLFCCQVQALYFQMNHDRNLMVFIQKCENALR